MPDDITRFARTLRDLPEADRPDHFANAVIEGGGTYAVIGTGRSIVSLQYLGLHSIGRTETEAIQSWIDAAMIRHKVDFRDIVDMSQEIEVSVRRITDMIDQWERDGMPIARKDRLE